MATYGKTKEADLYTPQGASRVWNFNDINTAVDFTTLTAATFDVWDSVETASTNRISKTLGAGVTLTDSDTVTVEVSDTDSNIAAGVYWFELWVTTAGSDRYLLKFGDYHIEDTRKND